MICYGVTKVESMQKDGTFLEVRDKIVDRMKFCFMAGAAIETNSLLSLLEVK